MTMNAKSGYCSSYPLLLLVAISRSFAVVTTVGDTGDITEFCQWETMKARCRWNSEVIIMTSARWGRMENGRCLNIHQNFLDKFGHDPLFLGCSEDVLTLVDKKCSGRSECDIRIPDPDLDKVTPCYTDHTRYLEASYTCVRVVQESRSCTVTLTTDQQYVSSSTSSSDHSPGMSSSCGSKSHPWRLEAPAGQRINISLIDFVGGGSGQDRSRDRDASDGSCVQYGFVVEKLNKKNVSLCAEGGAERQRESAVYTSDTNSVEIVLVLGHNQRTNTDNYNFLIKVQAVGCTNVIPPDDAWLKRSNNDIIIGCYSSQQTWQLKCDGHDWKGTVGTCPELYVGPAHDEVFDEEKDESSPKLVLAVVIAIAVAALVICMAVICIGCLCLRRYKPSATKKPLTSAVCTDNSWSNGRTTFAGNNGGHGSSFVRRLPLSAGTQLLNQQQQQPDTNYRGDGCQLQQQSAAGANSTTVAGTSAQYFVLDNEQRTA